MDRGRAPDRGRSRAATIAQKIVTYDFARQMEGAKKVQTSEFGAAIVSNMDQAKFSAA